MLSTPTTLDGPILRLRYAANPNAMSSELTNDQEVRVKKLKVISNNFSKNNSLNNTASPATKVGPSNRITPYFKDIKRQIMAFAKDNGIPICSVLLDAHTDFPHLREFEMILPNVEHREKLKNIYRELRGCIAKSIGKIPGPNSAEPKNSAKDEEEVYRQCVYASNGFRRLVCDLANGVQGKANFGPENEDGHDQIIKDAESYCRKIDSDIKKIINEKLQEGVIASQSEVGLMVIKKLGDVLRATIIIDDNNKLKCLIGKICALPSIQRQLSWRVDDNYLGG